MGGELGAGPGAAGGCGPASLPPPRDYLVPAAAMSPGRNVPPQIMLFISLGGSTARQHQAPGGRCARSPALPSSPCAAAAAAAAAPGLGLAAAPAPTQVSPGRARQLEGVGCGCGCGWGADARGWGARRERRGGAGPRGRLTRGALGTGRGPSPGCRAWGRHGAREALTAAAANSPGRGNPRGLREALGELGACFGEADPGASPGGTGRAVRGVHVLVPGCLPQDSGLGAKRVLSLACPTFPLPSLPPQPDFSALGLLGFSSGELGFALPGQP